MASSINAVTTGVGGVVTTADNSGILKLQTSGVDALTVNASQKVTFANTITPVVDSINGGQLAGMRNRIINGDMRVAQRGTSVVPALGTLSAYTLDRWLCYQTGAAATFAQTAGNGSANAYCLSFTGVASNTEVTIAQCIESINCYDLPTGAITVSCWLYSTVAKTITLALDTPFVSADAFNVIATLPSGTLAYSHPGGNTWQYVTFTYSAALATASATAIRRGVKVRFAYGATTTGSFAVAGVQLEGGSVATPFEQRPYGMELALCQRYCQSFESTSNIFAFGSSGFFGDVNTISFATQCYGSKMRTYQPTVTTTGTQATDFGVSTSAGVYQSGFTFSSTNFGSQMVATKTTHGLTPANTFIGIATGSGRITLSSEL